MRSEEVPQVLVLISELSPTRHIGAEEKLSDRLIDRTSDIQLGIHAGVKCIMDGLPRLPRSAEWAASSVTATFGIGLTAEAGVLISKAGISSTFEVSVTFERLNEREVEADE